MTGFLVILRELLSYPMFPLQIGMLVISAMFLGAIVDMSWRTYKKWIIAGVIFIIFEIWINVYLTNRIHTGFTAPYVNAILTVFMFVLYVIGIAVGNVIVIVARKPYRQRRKKLETELNNMVSSFHQKDQNAEGE